MKKLLLIGSLLIIGIAGSVYVSVNFKEQFSCKPSSASASGTVNASTLKNVPDLIPVAIIGAGPAGLSAALFAAREQYYTVVFKGPKSGGLLADTALVENWPGILRQKGGDIMKTLEQQVQNFGGVMVPETVTHVNFASWPFTLTTSGGKKVHALTAIIATGAQPRKLNIPGEETYWGKGVATCTLCDAPFTKDQDVYIIGGGDTALEHAVRVSPYARSITLVVNESKLNASLHNTQKLKAHPGINIMYSTELKGIIGENDRVTGVTLRDKKTNTQTEKPANWVFLAIGYDPNSVIFKDYLRLDPKGVIYVAPYTQETSIQGVYAAGKVANAHYKLGAIASGEGIKAGLDAVDFLEEHELDISSLEPFKNQFFKYTAANTPEEALPSITTKAELEELLAKNTVPVLLEIFSPTCPHCQAMEPLIKQVAHEFAGKIVVVQANINKAKELSKEFEVLMVPTFVLFVDKKPAQRKTGELTIEALRDFAQKTIKS